MLLQCMVIIPYISIIFLTNKHNTNYYVNKLWLFFLFSIATISYGDMIFFHIDNNLLHLIMITMLIVTFYFNVITKTYIYLNLLALIPVSHILIYTISTIIHNTPLLLHFISINLLGIIVIHSMITLTNTIAQQYQLQHSKAPIKTTQPLTSLEKSTHTALLYSCIILITTLITGIILSIHSTETIPTVFIMIGIVFSCASMYFCHIKISSVKKCIMIISSILLFAVMCYFCLYVR